MRRPVWQTRFFVGWLRIFNSSKTIQKNKFFERIVPRDPIFASQPEQKKPQSVNRATTEKADFQRYFFFADSWIFIKQGFEFPSCVPL